MTSTKRNFRKSNEDKDVSFWKNSLACLLCMRAPRWPHEFIYVLIFLLYNTVLVLPYISLAYDLNVDMEFRWL